MSAPTNEQMAHECLHTAERATSQWKANIEGMAAQTYATLALVDELRQLRESLMCNVTDAVREEVSDALVDTLRYREIGVKGGAA